MSKEYDDFEVVIEDLDDEVDYYKFLIHADSGVGKTVFAGSDLKVLFLAPEKNGLISAKRMGSKAKHIKMSHWEHLRKSVDYLEAHPEIVSQLNWIVVDSITEMQKLCSEAILENEAPGRLAKSQDAESLQIQDYGKLYVLMENLIRALNDMPVNVLYIAHSRLCESPQGEEFVMPNIGSQKLKDYKLSTKIVSQMTSYGYMRAEIVEVPAPTKEEPNAKKLVKRRAIYWEDTQGIKAKDRTCRLGPVTYNATLQQIRRCADGAMVRNADGFIVKPDQIDKAAKPAPAVVVPPGPKPTETALTEADADKASPDGDAPVESTQADVPEETEATLDQTEKETETTEETKAPETVEA